MNSLNLDQRERLTYLIATMVIGNPTDAEVTELFSLYGQLRLDVLSEKRSLGTITEEEMSELRRMAEIMLGDAPVPPAGFTFRTMPIGRHARHDAPEIVSVLMLEACP